MLGRVESKSWEGDARADAGVALLRSEPVRWCLGQIQPPHQPQLLQGAGARSDFGTLFAFGVLSKPAASLATA